MIIYILFIILFLLKSIIVLSKIGYDLDVRIRVNEMI